MLALVFFTSILLMSASAVEDDFPEAFQFDGHPFVHEVKTVSTLDTLFPSLKPSLSSTTTISPKTDAIHAQPSVRPSVAAPSTQSTFMNKQNSAETQSLVAEFLEKDKSAVLQVIEHSPPETLVVMMFYVYWCPHCHRVAPVFKRLAYVFRCTPNIVFLAFECAMNWPARGDTPSDACSKRNITSYPTLQVYSLDAVGRPTTMRAPRTVKKLGEWITKNTRVTQIQHCTGTQNQPYLLPAVRDTSSTPEPQVSVPTSFSNGKRERWDTSASLCPDERLHDAILGLIYLLKNWVIAPTSPSFSDVKYERLEELIRVTAKLFPGANVRKELAEFQLKLSKMKQTKQLTGADFHQALDALSLAGLRSESVGVQPRFLSASTLTGSVWIFFHTLTVAFLARGPSAIRQAIPASACSNVDRTLKADNFTVSAEDVAPQDLVEVIRNTVSEFFFCTVCQSHFLRTTYKCSDLLCGGTLPSPSLLASLSSLPDVDTHNLLATLPSSRYGVVLWLWKIHNRVTYRTAVERTSDARATLDELQGLHNYDAQHPVLYENMDVRFPPPQLCPRCRTDSSKLVSDYRETGSTAASKQEKPLLRARRDTQSVGLCGTSDKLELCRRQLSNNFNGTKVLSSSTANVFPEESKNLKSTSTEESRPKRKVASKLAPPVVSEELVMALLNWERMARGLIPENDSVVLPDTDDAIYDRIDGYNLTETAFFLFNYFWRTDWSPDVVSLMWDAKSALFRVVPLSNQSATAYSEITSLGKETSESRYTTMHAGGIFVGVVVMLLGLSGKWIYWFRWVYQKAWQPGLRNTSSRTLVPDYSPVGRFVSVDTTKSQEITAI